MADAADKRELGGSLIFIGLATWVADLLVVFYLPALTKAGQHASSAWIIAMLALVGLALMIVGYALRGKTEPS